MSNFGINFHLDNKYLQSCCKINIISFYDSSLSMQFAVGDAVMFWFGITVHLCPDSRQALLHYKSSLLETLLTFTLLPLLLAGSREQKQMLSIELLPYFLDDLVSNEESVMLRNAHITMT